MRNTAVLGAPYASSETAPRGPQPVNFNIPTRPSAPNLRPPSHGVSPQRPVVPRNPQRDSIPAGPIRQAPAPPVTVAVAEWRLISRCGIRAVLEQARGIEVVAEADNARTALEMTLRHRPRVLLLGVEMAGEDARTVKAVRRLVPETAVLVLAAGVAVECVDRVLCAGISGYLPKDTGSAELVDAVRVVADAGAVLSPDVAKRVLDRVAQFELDRIERSYELLASLSDQERRVIALIAEGKRNRDIGRALFMSEGGVKAHVSRLLAKLGCSSRVGIALIARDAGLMPGAR
jgi:DNA-binding NarL/FixJ family response regulator